MERLIRYDWPGNVRELRNSIEYAFVLCPSGGIGSQHLPPKILDGSLNINAPVCLPNQDEQQKQELLQVLRRTLGNQSEASRILGVSRVTVWKRIKKYGIDLKREVRA